MRKQQYLLLKYLKPQDVDLILRLRQSAMNIGIETNNPSI